MMIAKSIDVDAFFKSWPRSRRIYDVLTAAIDMVGSPDVRVGKSQISFRRRKKALAWAWVPGRYLRGVEVPLVLTLSLRRRDTSTRWKQELEPAEGRYTHHLELWNADDIDAQVLAWIKEAWDEAA